MEHSSLLLLGRAYFALETGYYIAQAVNYLSMTLNSWSSCLSISRSMHRSTSLVLFVTIRFSKFKMMETGMESTQKFQEEAAETARRVKVLAEQAWPPAFNPKSPQRGENYSTGPVFCVLRQQLYMKSWLAWISLHTPGWPQTCTYSPNS